MNSLRHTLLPLSTAAIVAILATGCAADSDASTEAPAAGAAGSTPPAPTDDPTAEFPQLCPYPGGGLCVGDLKPGTYRTKAFQPHLRYTVGRGWVNAEDLPGQILLYRKEDSQDGLRGGSYIGAYLGVRVSDGCKERWAKGIGDDPADLLIWYNNHPGLKVTGQRAVTVGGLRGTSIDLQLADDYRKTCRWSEGNPTVPLIIGNGVSELFHTILPGMGIRLVLLEWRDTNITIEITSVSEQHSIKGYRDLTDRIIDSFKFGH